MPKRVEAVRAAFSMTRAAQNMLLLLAAEERCGPHSRLLCSHAFASVLPSASIKHGRARWGSRRHGYLPRGVASRVAGPPLASVRQPRREEELLGFAARAIGIALGSAGGASLPRVARS